MYMFINKMKKQCVWTYNYTICVGYAVFVLQTMSLSLHCLLNHKPWLWKCQRAAQKADFISASVSPLPGAQGDLDHSREFSSACCSVLCLCFFFFHPSHSTRNWGWGHGLVSVSEMAVHTSCTLSP